MIIRRQIGDPGQVWIDTIERVRSLLAGCSDAELSTPVAGAGDRAIGELVARIDGLIGDASSGIVHGLLDTTPSSGSTGELVAGLGAHAEQVTGVVGTHPDGIRLIAELATAEQDLRSALDRHAARDDDAVILSIEYQAGVLAERLAAAGAPGLRITCEQWGYDTAETCHEILVADRFELFRAMNGRRSAAEVRRWMWSSDPAPFLPYLAVWGSLRETDLDEVDPTIPPEYAARLRGQNWREPISR